MKRGFLFETRVKMEGDTFGRASTGHFELLGTGPWLFVSTMSTGVKMNDGLMIGIMIAVVLRLRLHSFAGVTLIIEKQNWREGG